jgi:WD40 repeat protein
MNKLTGLLLMLLFFACKGAFAQKVEAVPFGDSDTRVYDLCFRPDGQLLASTRSDQVLLWNPAGFSLVRQLSGHKSDVLSVAFAPSGDLMAAGTVTGELYYWQTDTGTLRRSAKAHTGGISDIAFSPDGSAVVTGGADGMVRYWNVATGELLHTFSGHTGEVTCVAFSRTGSYIISGSADHQLKVWSIGQGTVYKTLSGHRNWVRKVEVHPSDSLLVSSGDDGKILLWDLQRPQEVQPTDQIPHLPGSWVTDLAFDVTGHFLLAVDHSNNLLITHLSQAEIPTTFYGPRQYKNQLYGFTRTSTLSKVSFRPGTFTIVVATLGKGLYQTDYYDKIFRIPHALESLEINKIKVDPGATAFQSTRPVVKIKGKISRPDFISKVYLRHNEEEIEVHARKNGRFSLNVRLKTGENKIELIIQDTDDQISYSLHQYTLAF